MAESYKEILLKHLPTLTNELVPNEALFDHLMARDVMAGYEREKINKKDSTDQRAQELVMFIMRRGSKAFLSFLYALENSNQRHLAELLAEDAAPLFFEGEEQSCFKLYAILISSSNRDSE